MSHHYVPLLSCWSLDLLQAINVAQAHRNVSKTATLLHRRPCGSGSSANAAGTYKLLLRAAAKSWTLQRASSWISQRQNR